LKPLVRPHFTFHLILFCLLAASSIPVFAQTTATSAPAFPKYKVMSVVYAPPGSASNVTYGNSDLVGSTDTMSTTNTTENSVNVSATVGGGIDLFSAKVTYNFSDSWTESNEYSNSIAIQTTTGNSISTMGPISSSLGVDHDNDIIYIWLNPVLTGTASGSTPGSSLNWTGLESNSCDPKDPSFPMTIDQAVNGCDPNQYPFPDIVGIPVWCLKNPYFPAQGCAQWLPYTSRSWDKSDWGNDPNTGLPLGPGLTMRDYADILQADPFVTLNGNAVNVCHPTYGPSYDPNLTETIGAPLTPTDGGTVYFVDPAVSVARVNYADPYDPGFANQSPYSATNPQPTGFLPNSCLTANTANTTIGTTTSATMNRFQPYGAVEYPVPGPNGLPSTYTGTFQYSETQTKTTVATDSHTVSQGVSVTASSEGGFWNASVTAGYSNSATWQQQSSKTSTSESTASASYSITGPQLSDNYVGPATYNVYLDNIYGTYAFYSNIEDTVSTDHLGVISISAGGADYCNATGPFPCYSFTTPVPVGGTSAVQTVTLTNTSGYPIVMAGPAVTFSDSGFQIAPGGTDTCSNQQLAASSTANSAPGAQTPDFCTLQIEFAPVASDIPDPIYGTNKTIVANIIAAGTVNVSSLGSYQNILTTNYGYVSGIAEPATDQYGATLLPVNQNSNVPNAYIFTTASDYKNSQSAQFTFTNLSTSSVTFPSYTVGKTATDMILTDSADFTVTSDQCNGLTVQPLSSAPNNTCTFTLQFFPATPALSGTFATRITATNVDQNALATAGATGTTPPALTVTPYYSSTSGSVIMPLWSNNFNHTYIYDWAEPITITNNTSGTVTFVKNNSPTTLQDPLGKDYSCESEAGTTGNLYFTGCVFTTATTSTTSTPIVSPWGYIYGQLSGQPEMERGDGAEQYSKKTGITIPGYSGGVQLNCYGSLAPFSSCNAAVVAFLPVTTYSGGGTPRGWDSLNWLTNGQYQEMGPNTFTADFTLTLNGAVTIGNNSTAFSVDIPVEVDGTNCNGDGCPSAATVQIAGTEQSSQVVTTAATPATGSIQLSAASSTSSSRAATAELRRRDAAGNPSLRTPARLLRVTPTFTQSTLSVGVGGFTKAVTVPSGTSVNDAATLLAAQLNASGSPVKAVANGSVVNLTSVATGSAANLPLSSFVIGNYQATPSGKALAGGTSAGTVTNYDSGTVQVTTHGVTASAPWGSASTPESIASALADAINQVASAYWNATASGNVVIFTSVSDTSTSVQTAVRKASATGRKVAAKVTRPAATTSATSNQIVVTVVDSGGFAQPSFSATVN